MRKLKDLAAREHALSGCDLQHRAWPCAAVGRANIELWNPILEHGKTGKMWSLKHDNAKLAV